MRAALVCCKVFCKEEIKNGSEEKESQEDKKVLIEEEEKKVGIFQVQ